MAEPLRVRRPGRGPRGGGAAVLRVLHGRSGAVPIALPAHAPRIRAVSRVLCAGGAGPGGRKGPPGPQRDHWARHLDMWTALVTGLVDQQVSNDPGGARWTGLIEESVAMFLAHCRSTGGPRRLAARRSRVMGAHEHDDLDVASVPALTHPEAMRLQGESSNARSRCSARSTTPYGRSRRIARRGTSVPCTSTCSALAKRARPYGRTSTSCAGPVPIASATVDRSKPLSRPCRWPTVPSSARRRWSRGLPPWRPGPCGAGPARRRSCVRTGARSRRAGVRDLEARLPHRHHLPPGPVDAPRRLARAVDRPSSSVPTMTAGSSPMSWPNGRAAMARPSCSIFGRGRRQLRPRP